MFRSAYTPRPSFPGRFAGGLLPAGLLLRGLLLAGLLLAGLGAATLIQAQDTAKRGRKYKAPPATARVEVTVLRATNGKPVENAAVVFHPLADGRDKGNMELKTDDEGKAVIDLLPVGSSVRVQVIADGFQTYGEDYKVDKDQVAIEVKLNRPGQQYSIYKKSEGREADKNEPGNNPDKNSGSNSDKDSDKDKPAAKPDDAPKPDSSNSPKDGNSKDVPKDAAAGEAKPQGSASPK